MKTTSITATIVTFVVFRSVAQLAPSTNDIWDVSHGVVVTSHSPMVVCTFDPSRSFDAKNIFGGQFSAGCSASFEPPGVAIFQDGMASGFAHEVEWRTPSPVTVRSFNLWAAGDGDAAASREFASFRLLARSPGSSTFDLVLHTFTPTHPYTWVYGIPQLVISTNIQPTTAQDFRAEFINRTGPSSTGPRIIELDGFTFTNVRPRVVFMSGATLFSADTSGAHVGGLVWDTMPDNLGFWNLWFTSGTPGGSPDGLTGSFLNGPDDSRAGINLPLSPGIYEYTIFGDIPISLAQFIGLNLFFNGHVVPDISALAASRTGQMIPPFIPNSSQDTFGMDWNGRFPVPGSGSLTFIAGDLTVTLSDFYWATPDVFALNRVAPYSTDPSANVDCIGSFTLSVEGPLPGSPVIVQQPHEAIIIPGSEVRFTVLADGASPLNYRWQFNGSDLASETNSILVISNVAAANLGAYKVIVSNGVGSVTSEPALLAFQDINRGLVAWYPFDNNANDASGNTNHGSVIVGLFGDPGARLVPDRYNAANRAYSFDGGNDSIVAPGLALPTGNSARTIIAWIRPEDHEDILGILYYPQLNLTAPSRGSISGFGRRQDRLYFWGGGAGMDYQSALSLPANQWSFVAISYADNELHVWVNSRAEAITLPALNTPPGKLSIGAGAVGAFGEFFKGVIDDVRIYSRALADVEIDILYNTNRVPVVVQQPVDATVLEEADVSFSATGDGPGPLSYQWQHNGVDLVGQTNSSLLLFDVSTNQAGSYRVIVSNSAGGTPSEPVLLAVTPVLTLPVALDATTLYWRTGGNRSWLAQINVAHDGVDAVQSGVISHYQESWIETTVVGPGTVAFWWRVSCEPGFDKYQFFVGERLEWTISDEVDWEQRSISVPAGRQTLSWIYSKDGSGSAGQDRAWLDRVVYTPNPGIDQPFYVVAKRRFPDGRFKLTFIGAADRRYTVEGSSNLADWTPLVVLTNGFGTIPFVDTEAAGLPHRFYRAVAP